MGNIHGPGRLVTWLVYRSRGIQGREAQQPDRINLKLRPRASGDACPYHQGCERNSDVDGYDMHLLVVANSELESLILNGASAANNGQNLGEWPTQASFA